MSLFLLLNRLPIRIVASKHRTFSTFLTRTAVCANSVGSSRVLNQIRMSNGIPKNNNMTENGNHLKTNRLAFEKSPYLLQHATNPVDWFPWGDEAFEKARAENKLIFLSVGYSTCHWCHVMEKESFEDVSVAELMNEHYVSIKVDREERPDVDKMYMAFIQATVGGGGWPMSVFLTPTLEPLAGGTYFYPDDKLGRPGFRTVLKSIAEQWKTKEVAILKSGRFSLDTMKKVAEKEMPSSKELKVPDEDCAGKCFTKLSKMYDEVYGGFATNPKFPQPCNFNLLFHIYSQDKYSEQGARCVQMCLHTLKKMAYGGIHDHVNSGFARYSVDRTWHVPHFEKMLYDQAQLTLSYLDGYLVTKENFFSDVVHDILTYVSRDLSHDLGGFYSAEDADSYPYEGAAKKNEGAFCLWDYDDICKLLDLKSNGVQLSELFIHHFNVKKGGNVKPGSDPYNEFTGKNILICLGSYEDTSTKFNVSVAQVKEMLKQCYSILYVERQKRPKPLVDTKMVTAWNAMMISAFAKAGFVLKEQKYVNRAILAANFIKKFLYNDETSVLLRCCYRGTNNNIVQNPTPIHGFLDDYAFLIKGLLDLYEATFDVDWLLWAEALQEQQDRHFWDSERYGYFTNAEDDPSILIRGKEDQDGSEPCGNSIAVHNLLRLCALLDRADLKMKAARTLTAFNERLVNVSMALPEMISGLLLYHNPPPQIFIAGKIGNEDTEQLLDVIRSQLIPGRILTVIDESAARTEVLYKRHEIFSRLKPINGKTTVYLCKDLSCSLPITTPEELAEVLQTGQMKLIDLPGSVTDSKKRE